MIDLPSIAGGYGAILADPPWHFSTRSPKGRGRSPDRHYQCLSLDEIKSMPVSEIAANDCALFMWAIDPMIPQAIEVISSWWFTFKTKAFEWVKTTKAGWYHMGTGYWTRANPESCFLATRGRPSRIDRSVPRPIVAPRREHSRKPEEARQRIERLVSGPYLELFSRQSAPGWDCWGDEAGKFD